MKTPLTPLYNFFGMAGAVFIVLTLLIQLIAIVGRFFQFSIGGHDAYAGYFLAAGTFFALAHTLRRGDHIRVTLIIGRLHGAARLWMEILCLAVATFLSGYFAYYAARLAWGSWSYNDISTEIDATPLWIPQLSMALGVAALFLAFAEECIYVLWRRRLPDPRDAERTQIE
ncbi:MAG TPA: TRAP transporter small permease [Afifellaceae bacterium]|nr:TRAP transporter small permease [Afifellaceae bacterium]